MASGEEWVTWPQAAEIVGCPVPTIDWYTRNGRIEKRPFRGPRPSLKRASVEEFAPWWRERQRAREHRRLQQDLGRDRRRAREQPPAPAGWMSTGDAAAVLAVTSSHVVWLVRRGHLEAHRTWSRSWVRTSSVESLIRFRQEEAQWISAAAAATFVGCSAGTILRAAASGQIVQRRVERQRPSLSKDSVVAYWRARAESVARRPPPTRDQRPASSCPDDVHTWLTTRQVAEKLGLSASRVNQLARRELLPSVTRGARRWFRGDHVELILNARAAERDRNALRVAATPRAQTTQH